MLRSSRFQGTLSKRNCTWGPSIHIICNAEANSCLQRQLISTKCMVSKLKPPKPRMLWFFSKKNWSGLKEWLCRDPKDMPMVMYTKVFGNWYFFPWCLQVNATDYKEVVLSVVMSQYVQRKTVHPPTRHYDVL